MTGYRWAVGAGVVVVLALTVARVVEVETGHPPTPELTSAFSSAVAIVLAMVAAGHFRNGH